MQVPNIYPIHTHDNMIELNKKEQEKLINKMNSDDINDYKISLNQDNIDTSMVIIGVNVDTYDLDIYGYDYNIEVLEYIVYKLKQKFKNYIFTIKRYDSVI